MEIRKDLYVTFYKFLLFTLMVPTLYFSEKNIVIESVSYFNT